MDSSLLVSYCVPLTIIPYWYAYGLYCNWFAIFCGILSFECSDWLLNFVFANFDRNPRCTSSKGCSSWIMTGTGSWHGTSTQWISQLSRNRRPLRRTYLLKPIEPIPKWSCWMDSLACTRVTWISFSTLWDLRMTMRFSFQEIKHENPQFSINHIHKGYFLFLSWSY